MEINIYNFFQKSIGTIVIINKSHYFNEYYNLEMASKFDILF